MSSASSISTIPNMDAIVASFCGESSTSNDSLISKSTSACQMGLIGTCGAGAVSGERPLSPITDLSDFLCDTGRRRGCTAGELSESPEFAVDSSTCNDDATEERTGPSPDRMLSRCLRQDTGFFGRRSCLASGENPPMLLENIRVVDAPMVSCSRPACDTATTGTLTSPAMSSTSTPCGISVPLTRTIALAPTAAAGRTFVMSSPTNTMLPCTTDEVRDERLSGHRTRRPVTSPRLRARTRSTGTRAAFCFRQSAMAIWLFLFLRKASATSDAVGRLGLFPSSPSSASPARRAAACFLGAEGSSSESLLTTAFASARWAGESSRAGEECRSMCATRELTEVTRSLRACAYPSAAGAASSEVRSRTRCSDEACLAAFAPPAAAGAGSGTPTEPAAGRCGPGGAGGGALAGEGCLCAGRERPESDSSSDECASSLLALRTRAASLSLAVLSRAGSAAAASAPAAGFWPRWRRASRPPPTTLALAADRPARAALAPPLRAPADARASSSSDSSPAAAAARIRAAGLCVEPRPAQRARRALVPSSPGGGAG